MSNKVQHVTTEDTSVRHKRHMLLACFGAVLSCLWFFFSLAWNLSEPTANGGERIALSMIPILCCVVWLCAIKVRVWWIHGWQYETRAPFLLLPFHTFGSTNQHLLIDATCWRVQPPRPIFFIAVFGQFFCRTPTLMSSKCWILYAPSGQPRSFLN